jgi:hypothetical protein
MNNALQLSALGDRPRQATTLKDPPVSIDKMRWPSLNSIGLTPAAIDARRTGIGGSDANVLLSGDADHVLRLWREKRGADEPEDLSSKLTVMMGSWTEAFNRQWYACRTGLEVTEVGSIWESITHPWRKATLDGIVERRSAIWEAKHTNAFASADEVLARYMPQLQHNMAVAGLDLAILSVLYGNHKWETYEIARDWLYQDDLLEAEQNFWNSVLSDTPPVIAKPTTAPKPVAYRELNLHGNNAWAAGAADWIANVEQSRRHAASVKALKDLVPEDVCRAWGHGLEAKRSKSGALTFREVK